MNTNIFRQLIAGLRMLLVLTVVLGAAYPLVVWGVGRAAFRDEADGSVLRSSGAVVGSSLIGQPFSGPKWFHGRPSASDYDTLTTGGTNLGPNSPKLVAQIQQRRVAIAREDTVPGFTVAPGQVPADAVTASFSALDPYISPEYARLQIARVAYARSLPVQRVESLVATHTAGRVAGYLGRPRVNVVELNLALQH
ncbi:potassium-transporting ATPase subunit KdpC [Tsukamurella sp. 8F]|uniref:potassium-transporting ATPase subunit KdpC n=1 Tax=unclassified Tsukamurella TaxID=2633480 RepID=UPI0023B8FA9E|nr:MULTISPECIES: potassium-transporting ATPase subunit KdpC [unclassified Tsukamurella]MDF0530283.1 potassium-transporting ATPase subunit KdpC [Tsukamurella sp. 8J]MDF0588601.1 potassium-transporting ATPase subunit KdpC [Tsukamurella sp. 8F]